jgi:hypothetical protein
MGKLAAIGVLFCIPFILLVGRGIVRDIEYEQNCGGHLKRAGDASSIPIARQELEVAVNWLEATNKTTGYTSIIYKTPEDDIGFWYKNLMSALDQARKAESNPSLTKLEESNELMKLREVVLDHGDSGEKVTAPGMVSVYPDQQLYFWGGLFTLVLGGVGVLMVAVAVKG